MFKLDYNYNSLLAREQKQTYRSSYQLHRYNHESVLNNAIHRDIPPVIFVLVFLFLILIVLSQILLVHHSRSNKDYSTMQKVQSELKQMDETMETIIKNNILPIDKWRLVFYIQNYVNHFQYLIDLFNKFNQTKINSSDDKRYYCNEEPSQLRRLK
jgi:hypothetical protein